MLVRDVLIPHRTVVPLFSDVAGTVRLDCTVPEDVTATAFIPRFFISAILRGNPSTSHVKISPVPPQQNLALTPGCTVNEVGPTVITSFVQKVFS